MFSIILTFWLTSSTVFTTVSSRLVSGCRVGCSSIACLVGFVAMTSSFIGGFACFGGSWAWAESNGVNPSATCRVGSGVSETILVCAVFSARLIGIALLGLGSLIRLSSVLRLAVTMIFSFLLSAFTFSLRIVAMILCASIILGFSALATVIFCSWASFLGFIVAAVFWLASVGTGSVFWVAARLLFWVIFF